MSASLISVTPMIPSGGTLEYAVRFFTEQLGFRVTWEGNGMAGVERGGVSFNLVKSHNRNWADNASFSIGVHGLESLYQEYRTIPAKVGPLELKAWGRREFHLVMPSGVCLQFYERDAA